ncbi:MAG: 5'-nucleotidase C-terminal domain-containing protein [Pyrinomonadaceae bacterium]
MLKYFKLFLLIFPFSLASLGFGQSSKAAQKRAWITILSTTDLHGNILPIDYYTNKPDERGLARAATVIKAARRENPNIVLLDSGDTIQGSPLAYYHNRKNNAPPDPMMLAMNELGYDAMAIGNHEYNFGLGVLEKARREAKFPWLSANTYKRGTDNPYFKPYVVKEVGGVRLGILGLTTPGVPSWENVENYAGLEFREPVSEAKKWVAVLRDQERADVVIVAMHMGLEEDLRSGARNPGQLPSENAALAIAREVNGVDVVLMGHTHREVSSVIVNGVQLAQANRWGSHVARVDLYLERLTTGETAGKWRIAARQARSISVDDSVDSDPEVVRLAAPYDLETQNWLKREIGESSVDLTAQGGQFRDSALLDLIHRVQLDAGQADVSMAASFNPRARIAKGTVTVRDIAGLYVYENTLVVLEVTGQQLKEALEHSARYFKAYTPNTPIAELVDEKIPGYNFDIAEGVTYDLDISKPMGERVLNLQFRSRPLQPDQKLRLATNNYRVNGGGGYTMYKDATVLYRSGEEIRELIINWVEKHRQIPPQPTNNWRLLPSACSHRNSSVLSWRQ